MFTDPLFLLTATVAMLTLGLSKGGFAGIGMAAAPLLSLYVPPLTALAIMNLITFTYTWQSDHGELTQEELCEQFVKLTMRMVRTKTPE